MTLEEEIKRLTDNAEYERTHGNLQGCLDFRQLVEWLKELKQLKEQTNWIPVSERYPQIEDEYKYFYVTDDKGEVSVQKFYMSLGKDPQPYFSGMLNVVAWMPLPESYKAESEVRNEKRSAD